MKIKTKLFLMVLVPGVLFTAFGFILFYQVAVRHIKQEIYLHLETAAHSRADHVATFLEMLEGRMIDFSSDGAIKDALHALNNEPGDETTRTHLTEHLVKNKLPAIDALTEVFVLNRGGVVVASTRKEHRGAGYGASPFFQISKERAHVGDLQYDRQWQQHILVVAAPVLRNGIYEGVVAGKIRPESLYAILQNKSGLGASGEIYLANNKGLLISPCRVCDQDILEQKIEVPATKDYFINCSGKSVIGTYARIPKMEWTLFAEISQQQAYAQLQNLLWIFSIVFAGCLLIAAVVSRMLGITISHPIDHLRRAAEKIEQGDFEYRVGIDSPDEFGKLAKTFNRMSEELGKSYEHLEEIVGERTSKMVQALATAEKQQKELGKLSQAVEQSPSTVVITDLLGSIEYINPKFTQLTGYSLDEVKGQRPSLLKSGEQPHEVYEELWDSIREGREWQGLFHNKKKDGSLYWEFASISPIKNEAGEVTHYIKVAEDVTARKAAQDALQESELKYRSVVDNINVGIMLIGSEMEVLAVNRQVQQWFPEIAKKLKSVCFSILTGASGDVPCQDCPTEKTLQDGQVHETVIDATRGEEVRHYRVMSCPLKDKDGTVSAAIELIEDITERIKAERKVQEAVQLKAQFISVVSHELRTPLTAIKEGIALVHDGITGEINSEQKEFLSTAKRNVDRLARLINDVLDFQKLGAGKMEFNKREQDLNDVVQAVYQTMDTLVREKGLDFILQLEQSMPMASFDRDRLEQVLTNLVSNAIKYTDTGAIAIRTESRDNLIYAEVRDSGVGIREEDMAKLFEQFQQLGPDAARKTGGTGLGLVISKEIVEGHGGKIWAESTVGQGTIFSFILPIKERRNRG